MLLLLLVLPDASVEILRGANCAPLPPPGRQDDKLRLGLRCGVKGIRYLGRGCLRRGAPRKSVRGAKCAPQKAGPTDLRLLFP